MDQKQEKDFYRELDENQTQLKHGCLKVSLFFLVIVIIVGIIVFCLLSKIRHGFSSINLFSKNQPAQSDSQNNSQVENITTTDEDLNKYLNTNSNKLPIKYLIGSISSDGITVKGLWEALNSRIEFVAIPKIENNRVKISISKVTIAGHKAPNWLGGQVASILEKEVNNQLSQNSKIKIIDCQLQPGKAIVSVIHE